MFTKKSVINTERYIKLCREEAEVFMAGHDEKYTIPRLAWRCIGCGSPLEMDIRRDRYIDNHPTECCVCNHKLTIAVLNMRKN